MTDTPKKKAKREQARKMAVRSVDKALTKVPASDETKDQRRQKLVEYPQLVETAREKSRKA